MKTKKFQGARVASRRIPDHHGRMQLRRIEQSMRGRGFMPSAPFDPPKITGKGTKDCKIICIDGDRHLHATKGWRWRMAA